MVIKIETSIFGVCPWLSLALVYKSLPSLSRVPFEKVNGDAMNSYLPAYLSRSLSLSCSILISESKNILIEFAAANSYQFGISGLSDMQKLPSKTEINATINNLEQL